MGDKKRSYLEALRKMLEDSGNFGEMSIFTAEELNTPMDILRAEIPGFGSDLVSVLGEFIFLPIEEENILYFSTVLTLMHSVPKEAAPDIADAVARLNYYLPCGSFALGDNDQNLVFRFMMPISKEESDEDIERDMYLAVNTGIGTADRFEGYLKLVAKGEITTKEMIGMITA